MCYAERPREKLVRYGPGRLSEEELLAILLRCGRRGKSALSVAKDVIDGLGLEGLGTADMAALSAFPALGPVAVCEISAAMELGRRALKGKKRNIYLKPEDVWRELSDIRTRKKEHFVVFYLDTRNQEIKKEVISVGTLNYNLVHPREVFEPAVRNLSASVIVAHNHPSGCLDPSDEDISLTRRLCEAGKILGIELLDHIIVSGEGWLSLKEKHGVIR